jgi:hypothetical protein
MTRITCPHCGCKSSTSKTIPQGATPEVICPDCGQVFRVNDQGLVEVQPAPGTPFQQIIQIALKTTQAIGGGLARMGRAALEWNKARQEEKARKQEEFAKRELERIEAEKAELAELIPCPFCAEPIARNARKCCHCNEYLDVSLRPG